MKLTNTPILSGCVMSGPAMLVCGGVAAGAVLCYIYCDDILHQTPSNLEKHEKGQARKSRQPETQGGTQEEGQGRSGAN